jgi:hypothetical protein
MLQGFLGFAIVIGDMCAAHISPITMANPKELTARNRCCTGKKAIMYTKEVQNA